MIFDKNHLIVAVDPGWSHCGFAVLDKLDKRIKTFSINFPNELTRNQKFNLIGQTMEMEFIAGRKVKLVMEDYDPCRERITGTGTLFIIGLIIGVLDPWWEDIWFLKNREWAAMNERRIKSGVAHGYSYELPSNEHEWDALKMLLATDYQSKLEEAANDHPF